MGVCVVVALILAVVGPLGVLPARWDVVQLLLFAMSIPVTLLPLLALMLPKTRRRHRGLLWSLALLGVALLYCARWLAGASSDSSTAPSRAPMPAPTPLLQPPAPPGGSSGQLARVVLTAPTGPGPTALAASAGGVTVLTLHGFAEYDATRHTFPVSSGFSGAGSAIAQGDGTIAVVTGGTATLYDIQSGQQLYGPPITYSERAGRCVTISFSAVWLCNSTEEKVDRVGLSGRSWQKIPVSSQPESIVAVERSVWITTDKGELEHVDSDGNWGGTYDIPDGPNTATYGFGLIWIAYNDGSLIRINPITGSQVGPATQIARGTDSLAILGSNVWTLSERTDQLETINPETGRVLGAVHVPWGPAALVSAGGFLYSVSSTSDRLIKIQIGGSQPPQAPSYSGWDLFPTRIG